MLRTSPRDVRPLGATYRREGDDWSLCQRCGIERRVQSSRPPGLCADCRREAHHEYPAEKGTAA